MYFIIISAHVVPSDHTEEEVTSQLGDSGDTGGSEENTAAGQLCDIRTL